MRKTLLALLGVLLMVLLAACGPTPPQSSTTTTSSSTTTTPLQRCGRQLSTNQDTIQLLNCPSAGTQPQLCNGGPQANLLNGPGVAPTAGAGGSTSWTYTATGYTFVRGSPTFVLYNGGTGYNLYQLASSATSGQPPTGTTSSNLQWTYVNPASGGVVLIPAGNNSSIFTGSGSLAANTIYFFDGGTHTLGTTAFGQINPNTGDTLMGQRDNIGNTEATIDGQNLNANGAFDNDSSAVGGTSTGVVIEYLTIQNFLTSEGAITVNHDSNPGWTLEYNSVINNTGAGVGAGSNNVINTNCLAYNDEYGFDITVPVATYGIGNITMDNNDIGFNNTNGDYDENVNAASFSNTATTATLNFKSPMDTQPTGSGQGQHSVNVGAVPIPMGGPNFQGCTYGWCTNLSGTAAFLNGYQTVTGHSNCSARDPNLCTTITFNPSCSPSCTVHALTTITSGTVDAAANTIGISGGGKFFVIENGVNFTGNYVHDNGYAGIWPDTDNSGFNMSGNYFGNNWADGILYEDSFNAQIENNIFVDNSWGLGPSPSTGGVISGAIYINSSGSASLFVGANANSSNLYSSAFNIVNNTFTDNWSGISEYQNGDRLCPFQNDQVCPLTGNPATYTVASCTANVATVTAYQTNCRDSDQNIKVNHNQFNWTAANIPGCVGGNFCGYNGLFASPAAASGIHSGFTQCVSTTNFGNILCNGGTNSTGVWPGCPSACDSSPYAGTVIPNAISNTQNNVWANNTYCAGSGSWGFMGFEQGDVLTQSQWTSGVTGGPVGTGNTFNAQDAGSTFTTGTCS